MENRGDEETTRNITTESKEVIIDRPHSQQPRRLRNWSIFIQQEIGGIPIWELFQQVQGLQRLRKVFF